MLPFLKDYNFYGKKALVRCDFNVPFDNEKILDDFKLQRSLETIRYLKEKRAKIILISHLGRPGKGEKNRRSLKPIALKLEELLGTQVKFIEKPLSEIPKREIEKIKEGEVVLLENLRFEKGEKENDEKFARALANLGEVYINEAFAACHRKHASVVLLPKFLPHFAGLQLEKEIKALSRVLKNPSRPFSVIIGGVKVESKIKAAKKFLESADHLLFGGEIANILLRVKKICLAKLWPKEDICKIIEEIDLTNLKIHLPVDILASPDEKGDVYIRETGVGNIRQEENSYDIGQDTINLFAEIIKQSKTVVWAGPLGYFENEKFARGTKKIAEVIAQEKEKLFSIAGGGETIFAINKFNLGNKFAHLSTGGGAMLEFLAGEKLPGLEALKD